MADPEAIADLASDAAKRAWDKAKECNNYNSAAEVYGFALIEEAYKLVWEKLRRKDDSNSE